MICLKSDDLFPLQIILRETLALNRVCPSMAADVSALVAKQGLTDLLKYSVIIAASVPVRIIYPFVRKYFVKEVMIGAVKG